MSRNTVYTNKKAQRICELVSQGVPIYKLDNYKGLPSKATIYNWAREKPDFSRMINLARETYADMLFDECVGIADDDTKDVLESPNGQLKANNARVQRDRLRVETRFRTAGLLNPKFREKVIQQHEGGNTPITFITGVPRPPKTIEHEPNDE